jgi:hypothetical protein
VRPRWRIFYSDGATFSDRDGGPQDAPVLGVIAIAQDPATGPAVEFQTDFYWWHHGLGRWVGGDLYGRLQYELAPGWKRVLCGQTIAADDYNRIVARAMGEGIG